VRRFLPERRQGLLLLPLLRPLRGLHTRAARACPHCPCYGCHRLPLLVHRQGLPLPPLMRLPPLAALRAARHRTWCLVPTACTAGSAACPSSLPLGTGTETLPPGTGTGMPLPGLVPTTCGHLTRVPPALRPAPLPPGAPLIQSRTLGRRPPPTHRLPPHRRLHWQLPAAPPSKPGTLQILPLIQHAAPPYPKPQPLTQAAAQHLALNHHWPRWCCHRSTTSSSPTDLGNPRHLLARYLEPCVHALLSPAAPPHTPLQAYTPLPFPPSPASLSARLAACQGTSQTW
jgi:hypothetical protein